jgi:hypothetical protein
MDVEVASRLTPPSSVCFRSRVCRVSLSLSLSLAITLISRVSRILILLYHISLVFLVFAVFGMFSRVSHRISHRIFHLSRVLHALDRRHKLRLEREAGIL